MRMSLLPLLIVHFLIPRAAPAVRPRATTTGAASRLPAAITAKPPAAGGLPLARALALARAHAPTVAAAAARVKQARAAVAEHAAAWRPTIGLPLGYEHTDGGRFVANNGPDEYTLQAAIHIPLFDPARDAAYRSAKAKLAGARFNLEQAARGVDRMTLAAFFGVLQAQQALAVEQSGLETFQDEAAAARKRYSQGVGSRLDVDRARFAVAQQEAAVSIKQADFESASRQLESLLGAPVQDPLALPPELPLATGDLAVLARTRRPEVEAAQAQVRAAADSVASARAARHWPAIGPDLVGGWDANGPPAGLASQAGWSAGIGLTIPVYSGGAGAARVEEAVQGEAVCRSNLADVLRSLDLEVADDHIAESSAADQARLAARRVLLAHEELSMSRFGYQQGSVPLIEVLRTEQAAIRAAADLASARIDVELARYRLAWDVGAPLQ